MGTLLFEYKNQKVEGYPFKFIRYSQQNLRQPMHMHDYVQIAYVMKGVCSHQFRGKTLTVGKGDVFIIPPGIEHSLNAFDGKEFEIVLVDFMPYLVQEELHSFADSYVWNMILQEQEEGASELLPWLHISKDKQPLVEQLLFDIQDEFEHREHGYEVSTRISLVKLLILIERESRKFTVKRQPGNPIRLMERPFGGVIQYICDNYSLDIPLEKAAELAGMTPAYFSHAFKKETGQTFVDFVHEVRIERAMELIRQNVHTMTQVCFQVGFRHLSHFIRTFKKRTGLTPTEYKKTFAPSEK
ncbi:AraC family transcriptional regulator [Paenibacillus sp. HJGM_3]|uniref:AraC family transcriptional regulator n=1 Tax=Paenibacillus sp. HJGM_3 TaxID=3379816 RepID=UPI00385B0150